jgi:phage shock protein C
MIFRYNKKEIRGGTTMKRLYKSRKNKAIAGVCGGIAEYFNVDPVLVRLIAVLFLLTGGAALIAYIIGMIILPKEPWETPVDGASIPVENEATPGQTEDLSHVGSLIAGVILIAFGIHFLLRNIPFFRPYYWWVWDIGWHFFWPSILIAVGLLIILRARRS